MVHGLAEVRRRDAEVTGFGGGQRASSIRRLEDRTRGGSARYERRESLLIRYLLQVAMLVTMITLVVTESAGIGCFRSFLLFEGFFCAVLCVHQGPRLHALIILFVA